MTRRLSETVVAVIPQFFATAQLLDACGRRLVHVRTDVLDIDINTHVDALARRSARLSESEG